jgi:hypothetical protein
MRQDTTRLHDDKLDHSHGMDGLYVGFGKGVPGGHCMFGGVFEIVFISVLLPTVIVIIVVIAFSKGGFEIVFISALLRSSLAVNGHFEGVTQRHSVVR